MACTAKTMMRAVRVATFGGPEKLQVESNIPVPSPSPTQVLVEVKAAGINPVDTYIRSGTYAIKPTLPYIPGSDAAGIVAAVGSAVTKFKPGDKVFVVKNVSGGYAEYTAAEEGMVGHLEEALTFQEGAGLGVPCFTAYRALCIKGREKAVKGNTVLIHGASGAVGLACVQMAAAKDMKVLATAGTQDGLDLIKKNGATATFNHREEGYSSKIMEETNGEGPDLIIEMLANVNLETDFELVKRRGIIVIVGNRGTIEVNPRLLMQKESQVTGLILMNASQEEWVEMHAGIARGMKKGWLKPHINKEYTLEQAPQAHEDVINSKATLGKRVFVL